MDTFEILSTIRNYSGLETENKIGTNLLRRYANMGMQYVAQMLYSIFHSYLVTTVESAGQSGASIDFPGEALRIIDVERKDSNDVWRPASYLSVNNKSQVGINPNYKLDEVHPLWVHEGRDIYIYPVLSSTDVRLRYRRRISDLADGVAARDTDTVAALGGNASPDDDRYNGYNLAIYTVSDGIYYTLQGIYKCTDYVGSTKKATLVGTSIFTAGTKYHYALVPIVPEEYHNLIVDAGLIELQKARIVEGDWKNDLGALHARINSILQSNGVTVDERE